VQTDPPLLSVRTEKKPANFSALFTAPKSVFRKTSTCKTGIFPDLVETENMKIIIFAVTY